MTRNLGDPQFFKANLDVQRLQRVTSEINVLVGLSGQWTNDALLSSEEFGLGGIGFGRGFDPSELVGDRGVAGKIELQWDAPYQVDFVDDYQVFGFFDGGTVWNEDAVDRNLKRESLTSTGVGVRMDFPQDIESTVMVAFPINRNVETQEDRDPSLYFSLSRRF